MGGGFVPDRSTKGDFEAKTGVVFGERMSVIAMEQGMLSAGRTIVIGHGAGWIRRIARDVFPEAVCVLDLYHLKHRVR